MKVQKKLIWILLVFVLLLGGCGGDSKPVDGSNEDQQGEVTVIPSSTIEVLDNVAPTTAVPTARPLLDAQDPDPGVYLNDLYGVGLEYPTNWNVLETSQTDINLIALQDPSLPLVVILQSYLEEEDLSLDESNAQYMDSVIDELAIENAEEVVRNPEYVLADGVIGARLMHTGLRDGTEWVVDLVTAEESGRLFVLITLGVNSAYQTRMTTLDDLRAAFHFYSPSPYGVNRENALFLAGSEPRTLDPALMQTSAGSIIGDLYSGLVRLDTSMRPIPDLAEKWDVSDDGLVYTFYLRRGVQFHTGREFTAQDVIFSWERAADPALESPSAPTYLIDIKGVLEKLNGETDEISGLRMVDDYIIEVTLDAPKAYFLAKLSYPTSWIVDSETVDEIEDNPIGTGPFKMVKHEKDEIIILERNEKYYGGFVQLEYLVYLLYQGYSVRMYEGDQVDMVSITEDMLDRAEDPNDPLYGTVLSSSSLCTFYVLLDHSRPPFDDPKVREAFARAIDKERYNEIMTEGKGVTSVSLLPPGMPGYSGVIEPMVFDEGLALQALADSSYGSADALPEITFTARGYGSGVGPDVGFFVQSWEDVFGVSITVEQIQPSDYWDEVQKGNHGNVVNLGWCADYPDPENFLDLLFHSQADLNVANFNNPEYDALIESARVEADLESRLSLYQRAEQILVDQVGGIFLAHTQAGYLVTKPYVHGYVNAPIGIAQMMNVYIER